MLKRSTLKRSLRPILLAVACLTPLLATPPALAVYHPGQGRFLQRDPLGYPDGMNTYAAYHVLRGGVDPSGLDDIRRQSHGAVHWVPQGAWYTGWWDDWDNAVYLGQVGEDGRVTFDSSFGISGRPYFSKIDSYCGGRDDFEDALVLLRKHAAIARREGHRVGRNAQTFREYAETGHAPMRDVGQDLNNSRETLGTTSALADGSEEWSRLRKLPHLKG